MSFLVEHLIKRVFPKEDYKLDVYFHNGTHKVYNMKPLIEANAYDIFGKLIDKDLFNKAYVDFDGAGVIWNEDIDLACDEIWDNGEEVPCPFKGIMSFRDATDLWGLNESTLRKAVSYGKLKFGQDVYKYGKQWVITENAMIREYGDIEKKYQQDKEAYEKSL